MDISIDIIKESFKPVVDGDKIFTKGDRALVLFIRLKTFFISGCIKDFENFDYRKVGYATFKPFKNDVVLLLKKGYIRTTDRTVSGKVLKDINLVSWEKIRKNKILFSERNVCVVSLDPRSRNLREQLHAVLIQDSLCKQSYMGSKSSENYVKRSIVNGTTMDILGTLQLNSASLTTMSYETIAKLMCYKSKSFAHKMVSRIVELGYLDKFNQLEDSEKAVKWVKLRKGIYKFNVKALCNVYQVSNSLLPKMSLFQKQFAL